MSILEIRGLTVNYGSVLAVRGLDLDLQAGQIAAVLGANGAGKSSTMNAISGLIPTHQGSICFAGHDITGWPPQRIARKHLLHVPEGRRVFAPLTVEENLLVGAYSDRSKSSRTKSISHVYELFPVLYDRRRARAGLLSGGEQQMLAFGRALMGKPVALLLDEPSMGLAPIMVEKIMSHVTEIASRGISILMVEQNAVAALKIAETAYVMRQGEIVLHGPAQEVAGHPAVLAAFLGADAGDAPKRS